MTCGIYVMQIYRKNILLKIGVPFYYTGRKMEMVILLINILKFGFTDSVEKWYTENIIVNLGI
jgi:hypothetical protein